MVANDWHELPRESGELKVFYKLSRNNKQRVWVPLLPDASDYESMVFRVVRTVAEIDNKTEVQVLEDLQTVAIGDVIRVRVFDPLNHHNNSIPLQNGINLLTRAKQMVLAAASSAVSKKPIHPRRATYQAREFVKDLQLGQTERGSYLIKLISPINALPQDVGTFDGLSERVPFSRRAVIELMNGLEAINEAANRVNELGKFDFNIFLEAVSKGASANLCEALTSSIFLSGKEQQANFTNWPIDISVTWSYIIRDRSLATTKEVSFDPEIYPIIREAAKEFRMRNPEIVNLRGWVNILEKDTRLSPGLIRVIGKVEGRDTSVRIMLEPKDYDLAVDAHKNGLLISIDGTLVVEKNIFLLKNPSNVHLVADELRSFDFND